MRDVDQGSIYLPYILPPWPRGFTFVLWRKDYNDGKVEIIGSADGGLGLRVTDCRDSTILSFESQIVGVTGNGPCLIVFVWDIADGRFHAEINEQPLAPLSSASGILVVDVGYGSSEHPSTSDATGDKKCQPWIQNRKSKFAPATVLRQNRRKKSLDEQANDLRRAIISLAEHILSGNPDKIGHMASELRALLYWTKDAEPDATYEPLLLRMASKADLPLPVYAMKGSKCPIPVELEIADTAHIFRQYDSEEIVDLQEWLKNPILYLHGEPMSTLKLIAEIANTESSHISDQASEYADEMAKIVAEKRTALALHLAKVCELVVHLGEWVLSELKTKGLLSK